METEKENITPSSEVTIKLICRAVSELWLSDIICCQRRRRKIKERGYCNLKRKTNSYENTTLEPAESDVDWNCFLRNVPSSIPLDGWHATVNNRQSVSFVRVENVEYDGARVISEVNFTYAVEEKSVLVKLKYHERAISLEKVPGLETQLQQLNLADKVRFVLDFVDKSTICPGFPCDIEDDTPLSDSYVAHGVLDMTDTVKVPSKRFFSPKCLILTGYLKTAGGCCTNCATAKRQLEKIKRRRQSLEPMKSHTNHRYMSREEILEKLTQEKKRRMREQAGRERLEREMLDMTQEDHADLTTIMATVNKKDVPEEMTVLWEQQQKIIATSSSRAYRWHPK